MSESGNKETVGDIAIVVKAETPSQAEIKASNKRIKQMEQLQRKLKDRKMMITKNLNKLKPAMAAFQKVGSEDGTASLLKMKEEDIVKIREKLKEDEKEMGSVSTSLQEVMCESEPNELNGITQDAAKAKLEEDVE